MKPIAAILAACAPSLGLALAGIRWTTDSEPPDGFIELVFPITMTNVSHKSGYFFAQQFTFRNMDQVAHIGLQPREDKDGKSVIHAVFSSFQDGTKARSRNCQDGADGRPGVSCGVDFDGEYGQTYWLTIRRTLPKTWLGMVQTANTSEIRKIGEWTLPWASSFIKQGESGFVEYYPWKSDPSHSCKSLPKAEVLFGHPFSPNKGASGGRLLKPYENGDCVGDAGFSATKSYEGWTINLGFS